MLVLRFAVVTRAFAAARLKTPAAGAAACALASSASPASSHATATRLSDPRPLSKKQVDLYYSRIAAKLDKTNAELSLEAVDRTIAYLEALGLTKNLALGAVAMHPMMTRYSQAMLDAKVDWLRMNGVTGSMLVRAISRHPNILGLREQALVDLKTWYTSIGVPESKLPYLISVFPHAASASILENLEPKRQFLLSQGLSPSQVVSVMRRQPQFMTVGLERLEFKVQFLKTCGLSEAVIIKVLTNAPEVLGLAPDSIDAKLLAFDELLGSREATVAAWGSNARLIMYKSEQIRRTYAYLTTVVGMAPERIRRHPALMTRSVSGIVQPRYEFLRSSGFMSMDTLVQKTRWVIMPDTSFKERFPGYTGPSRNSSSGRQV